MADYESLIDRVRSGSGADRELDRHIWVALGFPIAAFRYDDKWRIERETFLTSSLDAVVRLVEEKLPGWSWQVGPFSKVRAQLAQPVETDFGPGIGLRADETAATPVRALLAALLTAIQAQETS